MRESLIQNINSDADVEKIGASLSLEHDDEQAVPSGSRKTTPESADFEADSRANQKEDSLDEGEVEGQESDEEALGEELIRSLEKDLLSPDDDIKYPPLKPIISPILNGGESMIIFAKTGVGKSWFALEMAKVISVGGTFLGRYSVETPRRVLYIDGEMGIRELKEERFPLLNIRHNPNFKFRTCNHPEGCKTLDFAEKESRNILKYYIKKCKPDVIFLDNLSTLYMVDHTNQQESWGIMQNFLKELRNSGLAVVVVDHAGKGQVEGPRGTSAKMDIQHTVIELLRQEGDDDEEKAGFKVTFPKHREFHGKDAKPFVAKLGSDGWEVSEVKPQTVKAAPNYEYLLKNGEKKRQQEEAFAMFDEGKKNTEVVESLGISKNTVSKLHKEWKEALRVKEIKDTAWPMFHDGKGNAEVAENLKIDENAVAELRKEWEAEKPFFENENSEL